MSDTEEQDPWQRYTISEREALWAEYETLRGSLPVKVLMSRRWPKGLTKAQDRDFTRLMSIWKSLGLSYTIPRQVIHDAQLLGKSPLEAIHQYYINHPWLPVPPELATKYRIDTPV